MLKKLLLPLTALILLTGCPSEQSYLTSKPSLFVKGYRDGCESAKRYWKNNLVPYKIVDPTLKKNPDYHEGWEDGYSRCYANEEMEIQMRRPGAFR
ncbi:hypothetical protein [Hydrogenimonas sp. SS33]|uniref:hypothetical protein n=1 Tax=Hydrogenimonas leucolamina TaxID=2954236 RepID=UPI00336BE4E2